jgi:hypothetical protein
MKTIGCFLAGKSAAPAIEDDLIAADLWLADSAAVNGPGIGLRTRFTSIDGSLNQAELVYGNFRVG